MKRMKQMNPWPKQKRSSEPPVLFSAQRGAAIRTRPSRATVPVGGARSPRSLGLSTRYV
jgi:hypothetical protein